MSEYERAQQFRALAAKLREEAREYEAMADLLGENEET